jgi:hypothetical protein
MEKAEGDGSPAHSAVGRRAAALSLTLLLIGACASGDVAAVVDLVSRKNADPFASDELGRTPLGVASEAGHIEVVKFLSERDMERRVAGGTLPHPASEVGKGSGMSGIVASRNPTYTVQPTRQPTVSVTPAGQDSGRVERDSASTQGRGIGEAAGNVAMGDLVKLSTPKGRHIRVLERSSMKFRDIGTILLQDDTGEIVTGIRQAALGNPVEAVRMIYERWIQENDKNSWKKLIQCFRDVQLNPLARDIEQRFGFSSPARSQAHPSHQIIGKADETVSEDDTKRGAQASRSSGLKRSAGSDTESPSSTRKQICTSLNQGLETKSGSPRRIGTQSEMTPAASLLQSEGGRKRKRVTQPPNEPTSKRCVSSTVEHSRRVTRSSASLKKK